VAEIVIDERFCEPPASGNGGYVAGRLAAYVGADGCLCAVARALWIELRPGPPA
jgi:hypothetical protein